MGTTLKLFLDLGDVFTKGIAVRPEGRFRFRFPSVVARRLLQAGPEEQALLLDDRQEFIRLSGFDPESFPRTRSFPAEASQLMYLPEVPRARFAGRIAATLGADRELLGRHPSEENIDALVHRAISKSAMGRGKAAITFVLDQGPKAEAIARYVALLPRTFRFLKWRAGRYQPELLDFGTEGHVIDAANCAAAALPAALALERVARVALVDIGYFRTKLSLVSTDGLEHQEQLDGLGAADCVRRILRDCQEQGLLEDEYAVILALERCDGVIEVAGRRADVSVALAAAREALEQELLRAIRRLILERSGGRGLPCRGVAIFGGGAVVAGAGLATRLKSAGLGLEEIWISEDPRFFLLEGALNLGTS